MDIFQKLNILASAAKYDVSCSSSGSSRKNKSDGIGNAAVSGICHSFTQDGRCISLLKILMTNNCLYDCAYCINRISNDLPRAYLTPKEICEITINFYKRNYIEGLFLSSAVFKSPNYTMELIIETVNSLRNEYNFNGYIHIKVIPGADASLIERAGLLVDRMSVNIELPSSKSLSLLAPQKSSASILKPMSLITSGIQANQEEKRIFLASKSFVPAGQSTQMIVGATNDSDFRIVKLTEDLYTRYKLKRVYFSAYVPVSNNPKLPAISNPPLIREHRLYQADWLLRFYGFSASELLTEAHPNFDLDLDPKTGWALNNISIFPLEVNRADSNMLLRIPGIGLRSVKKIIALRRVHIITYEDLKKLGVVLKRARYFLTCHGKYYGETLDEGYIRKKLISGSANNNSKQLSIFDLYSNLSLEDKLSKLTGEI